MRISDWSSDVCSSDLLGHVVGGVALAARVERRRAALDHACRQRDVLSDDQVAGADAFDDRAVGHVEAARHLDRVDEARGRRAQPLVCHQRSEEHTSELQSLMRISYAVFCLNKKNQDLSSGNSAENKSPES